MLIAPCCRLDEIKHHHPSASATKSNSFAPTLDKPLKSDHFLPEWAAARLACADKTARFGRSNSGANRALGVRHAGRQIHRKRGPGLPQWHAGADAPDHHAAPARRVGRAQHRRLRHRLSRLAARRARPGDGRRQEASRPEPHQVPAGRERGPGRHRALGHPAARPVRRQQIRRRVRHVVRQGPGRRPLRRRVPPRQPRRHRQARRRAGAGGRRPHLQVLHHRAPDRICLHGLRHPGPQSRQHPGVPGLRPGRLGGLALFRLLDRDEGGGGQLRFHRLGLHRPGTHRHQDPGRFRAARRRPQHPQGLHALHHHPGAGAGIPAPQVQALCRARLRPRQQAQQGDDRRAQPALRHRHLRQDLHGRAPGAGRSRHRRRLRQAHRPLALQGRHDLAAGARGRAPLRRGPRRDPGGRGKARADGEPAQGAAL